MFKAKCWLRRGVLIGLIALSGCASLSGLKPPEVAVSELSLGKVTLTEQRLKLRLRVTNPNERELALNGLIFQIEAGDKTIARGVGNQALVIAPLSEGLMDLEASLQMLELIGMLPRLLGDDGKFEYRLKGEAVTRDYGRIPFSRTGRMALPLGMLK